MENKAAQMDKVYNPQAIEGELYKEWEETGAFVAHRVEGKQPFTIVMPPPNITGQLHMGHAMDGVLQDSLTRYHRMKGDPTLWLPGTDHASIATEAKFSWTNIRIRTACRRQFIPRSRGRAAMCSLLAT